MFKFAISSILIFFGQIAAAQTGSLKASDVQILFAEMQPSFVSQSLTEKPQRIAEAAKVLAEVARILKIPMTFAIVPVHGKFEGLLPELKTFATKETTFSRTITSPFLEPKIVNALSANKRKTLIVVGFAAEVAVLQSALDALHAGYSVQVPVDAVGSISERTERAAFSQIEKSGATLTSVLSLVMAIAPDISNPPGSLTFAALEPILKPAKLPRRTK